MSDLKGSKGQATIITHPGLAFARESVGIPRHILEARRAEAIESREGTGAENERAEEEIKRAGKEARKHEHNTGLEGERPEDVDVDSGTYLDIDA